MVQGLAFLSKKSWHTKNLANQEKVWMAEQRKAAEESKTKELAKQIQQEREEEELDKIAGRKTTRLDRGIDWMYQGGTSAAAKEEEVRKNEEYLLGKEYQPEGKAGGDFAELETGGVNEVVAKMPAVAAAVASKEEPVAEIASINVNAEPSVADRNEAFRMRHEDPMFLVSQTQREKQNQQDKKRALYERVVGPTEDAKKPPAEDKEERRRLKKERKRERKQRKREERDRRHRKRRRRSRSRSRSRSPSREHTRHHYKRKHRSRSPSYSRSPERNSYSDEDRGYDRHRRGRSRSRSYERERRRYRSRSPSPRDYDRGRGRGYDREDDHRYESRSYDKRQHAPLQYQEEERRREDHQGSSRPEGFGLQGGKISSLRPGDLGPNQELLEQKRQERDAERRRLRGSSSTRRRMTQEEREAALQAMQSDASKRDELLNRAVAAKSERNDEDEHAPPSSGKASFLQDMAERTHGIRDGGSLSSRVAKNRHTNQKLSDGFL